MNRFPSTRLAAVRRSRGLLCAGLICAAVTQFAGRAHGAEVLDAEWLADAQAALRVPTTDEVAAAKLQVSRRSVFNYLSA